MNFGQQSSSSKVTDQQNGIVWQALEAIKQARLWEIGLAVHTTAEAKSNANETAQQAMADNGGILLAECLATFAASSPEKHKFCSELDVCNLLAALLHSQGQGRNFENEQLNKRILGLCNHIFVPLVLISWMHLPDEDSISDTELFYLISMFHSFQQGIGVLGLAYESQSHIRLTSDDKEMPNVCKRKPLAKMASIQSLVCVPALHGVAELGSIDIIYENQKLIPEIKVSYFDDIWEQVNEKVLSSPSAMGIAKQTLFPSCTSSPMALRVLAMRNMSNRRPQDMGRLRTSMHFTLSHHNLYLSPFSSIPFYMLNKQLQRKSFSHGIGIQKIAPRFPRHQMWYPSKLAI
ncbi:hypothetical protein L7F22_008792 [Adiantum nelumboides]|nr:hypothetical protein [Adiantum nelumboides]